MKLIKKFLAVGVLSTFPFLQTLIFAQDKLPKQLASRRKPTLKAKDRLLSWRKAFLN